MCIKRQIIIPPRVKNIILEMRNSCFLWTELSKRHLASSPWNQKQPWNRWNHFVERRTVGCLLLASYATWLYHHEELKLHHRQLDRSLVLTSLLSTLLNIPDKRTLDTDIRLDSQGDKGSYRTHSHNHGYKSECNLDHRYIPNNTYLVLHLRHFRIQFQDQGH